MFQPLELRLFAFLDRADIGVRLITPLFKATRRIVISLDLLANFLLQSAFVLPCIVAFFIRLFSARTRGIPAFSTPFQALFLTV